MLIHFKHSSCLFLCRIRMSPLKLFFFFYWRSPRQALAWRHAVLILDYSLENTEARCTKPGIDSPVQLWNLKLYKILFSCSPWISEAKQVVVNFNLNISIFFIFFLHTQYCTISVQFLYSRLGDDTMWMLESVIMLCFTWPCIHSL